MTKPQPKDIIALATIVAIVTLKLNHINGYLDAAFGIILGYYFAHRHKGSDSGV